MSEYKNQLESNLWAIADLLRGNMDANEYKNYILGFIFYKYLSEKIELYLDESLKVDKMTFKEAWKKEEFKAPVKKQALNNLGYFLEPEFLFSSIVEQTDKGEMILGNLSEALKRIGDSATGNESQDDFENLFEDVDLTSYTPYVFRICILSTPFMYHYYKNDFFKEMYYYLNKKGV
ncbi:MAG: type I restriction-modification system subunit M N-terminal domain-containing protein [archaeon]|nr:type I restriction-modification system subunit M N-terminal domain-containing protein [archaeon]